MQRSCSRRLAGCILNALAACGQLEAAGAAASCSPGGVVERAIPRGVIKRTLAHTRAQRYSSSHTCTTLAWRGLGDVNTSSGPARVPPHSSTQLLLANIAIARSRAATGDALAFPLHKNVLYGRAINGSNRFHTIGAQLGRLLDVALRPPPPRWPP